MCMVFEWERTYGPPCQGFIHHQQKSNPHPPARGKHFIRMHPSWLGSFQIGTCVRTLVIVIVRHEIVREHLTEHLGHSLQCFCIHALDWRFMIICSFFCCSKNCAFLWYQDFAIEHGAGSWSAWRHLKQKDLQDAEEQETTWLVPFFSIHTILLEQFGHHTISSRWCSTKSSTIILSYLCNNSFFNKDLTNEDGTFSLQESRRQVNLVHARPSRTDISNDRYQQSVPWCWC